MRFILIFVFSLVASVFGAFLFKKAPLNPLSGINLYTYTRSKAYQWMDQNKNADPSVVQSIQTIASTPTGIWLTGNSSDIISTIPTALAEASSSSSVPIFVIYNIPNRDCGKFSAGGAQRPEDYKNWITSIQGVIQQQKVIIIIEPDALANLECVSGADRRNRLNLISFAVTTFSVNQHAFIYIDAGHPAWQPAYIMAERLKEVGIDKATGFALNVSNFIKTNDVSMYGKKIAYDLGGNKTFVIDTGRNGNGPTPNNEWCNPSGRILGSTPTTTTHIPFVDAFLWIKNPGESDGTCNGGPAAGVFWPEYAQGLVTNASTQ